MAPAPQRIRVLILAREQVVAALLGLQVESDRFEPIFAAPNESPEDAIARVRPPLVVLLDGALDAARSDIFFAQAMRARARVIVLTPPRLVVAASTREETSLRDDVLALAEQRGLPSLDVTASRADIWRCLEEHSAGLA